MIAEQNIRRIDVDEREQENFSSNKELRKCRLSISVIGGNIDYKLSLSVLTFFV